MASTVSLECQLPVAPTLPTSMGLMSTDPMLCDSTPTPSPMRWFPSRKLRAPNLPGALSGSQDGCFPISAQSTSCPLDTNDLGHKTCQDETKSAGCSSAEHWDVQDMGVNHYRDVIDSDWLIAGTATTPTPPDGGDLWRRMSSKPSDFMPDFGTELFLFNDTNLGEEQLACADFPPLPELYALENPAKTSDRKSKADQAKGDKKFACNQCESRFCRPSHLQRHRQSKHTRKKPYHCSDCSKWFSRKDNLVQHRRSHCKRTQPRKRDPCMSMNGGAAGILIMPRPEPWLLTCPIHDALCCATILYRRTFSVFQRSVANYSFRFVQTTLAMELTTYGLCSSWCRSDCCPRAARHRLQHCHPLSRYPGPLFGRLTQWYDVCHAYVGDKYINYYQLHQEHGTIVRFSPNSLSINDPAALKAIYARGSNLTRTNLRSAGSWGGTQGPDRGTSSPPRTPRERNADPVATARLAHALTGAVAG
ncbi:hypothetical protein M409DRAFT_61619 [Zasmidium cellare ATCC 36951]|uniref:C2H2-type domain-containing protein n=1 Tax=Zasmidium cellare ATCC 36951 TaxID=1080233 RepID=A0A6A6BUW8_ZASCE|nr:uncharacterized protein M409DRAFT_61619 [Zasmidium cellare ATCC 36951]KAF2158485.1 hypothetical protein M409DRAFT_61619 [Zasmidium cellare ATCC 36951]